VTISPKVRAGVTLVIATCAYGIALVLRDQTDPWRTTALAATISIALAVWTLGRKTLALFAFKLRGALSAAALGIVLVIATHAGFRVVEIVSPVLAASIRTLYSSVDVGTGRITLVALTFLVVTGEELIWRGVAIELAGAASPVAAGARSVVLYALPQLAGGVPLLMIAAVALGALFAAQRLRTGRLTEPLLTHAIWSIAIFVVVPLTLT
jgi:uncharacterized protein